MSFFIISKLGAPSTRYFFNRLPFRSRARVITYHDQKLHAHYYYSVKISLRQTVIWLFLLFFFFLLSKKFPFIYTFIVKKHDGNKIKIKIKVKVRSREPPTKFTTIKESFAETLIKYKQSFTFSNNKLNKEIKILFIKHKNFFLEINHIKRLVCISRCFGFG